MTIAITREISSRFNECEITHIERTPINLDIARQQHIEYTRALSQLGCKVIELPEEPDLPDSVFVEDAAFILPEVAVITRPGADSRKSETESIARAISPYRRLIHVTSPATIDGGDVLVLGKNIYIGLSTRSSITAVNQLQSQLDEFGYTVTGIKLSDCLHLKTAVTRINDQSLLINPKWVDATIFEDYDLIEVASEEPFAANCLPIQETIIYPSSFPKTQKKLEKKGIQILNVNLEELAKAEGAVTCCSLIIE